VNRDDFQALLALPGKRVVGDLEFVHDPDKAPLRPLRSLAVQNTGEWTVKLDGWYHPDHNSLSLTFSCAQADGKPICRVDVRGIEHDDGGRTHKHELRRETCPRKNLPTRIERQDFETMAFPEIWRNLCQMANVDHQGVFRDPSTQ
jgi:hypothetical protein